MKEHAAAVVSDADFAARAERWPEDTPDTHEAYLIRDIFDGLFPSAAAAKTAVRSVGPLAVRPARVMLTPRHRQVDPARRLGLRVRPQRSRGQHPFGRVHGRLRHGQLMYECMHRPTQAAGEAEVYGLQSGISMSTGREIKRRREARAKRVEERLRERRRG
jgi:hypothetical protein